MIRDAVLHLQNEHPLLVDIFEMPSPSDIVLICTNLRTMSKTRPTFADRVGSTFIFPYSHIRFVELPTGAIATEPVEPVPAILLAEAEPAPGLAGDSLPRVHALRRAPRRGSPTGLPGPRWPGQAGVLLEAVPPAIPHALN